MPYKSRYVDSGKGIHKIAYGVLTSADLIQSAKRQVANVDNAKKLKYGLVDFSQVTELRLSTDTFERWIEQNRKLAKMTPGAFVAIVAPTLHYLTASPGSGRATPRISAGIHSSFVSATTRSFGSGNNSASAVRTKANTHPSTGN